MPAVSHSVQGPHGAFVDSPVCVAMRASAVSVLASPGGSLRQSMFAPLVVGIVGARKEAPTVALIFLSATMPIWLQPMSGHVGPGSWPMPCRADLVPEWMGHH